MDKKRLEKINRFALDEAKSILGWWLKYAKDPNGGFYGAADRRGNPDKAAAKHLVLAARLVWTFSSAARILKNSEYKEAAYYYYRYFIDNFIDKDYGGAYWLLNADGSPLEDQKQTYGEAFALYALSEYFRLTGDKEAKALADKQFKLLETKVYDPEKDGFYEARARDWSENYELRISNINRVGAIFTMNTSLHLMEGYANYLRIERNADTLAATRRLLDIMTKKVTCPNYRYALFFDENWKRLEKDRMITYGHDIEGSWLSLETAEIIGGESLIDETKNISLAMASAVLDGGFDEDGGLFDERDIDTGELHGRKTWWQQSEAAVGFFNAYSLSDDEKFLSATEKSIAFINEYIKDSDFGEWFIHAYLDDPDAESKITGWKCPYHNTRMCLELYERTEKLLSD